MAKKRKAQPLVPPAKRPATLKAAAASVEASVEAPAATVCLESAVVWLESALRVADNAALARAAARGPGGLAVIVVWRHGVKNPTPATSFQAHALRALGSDLRARGSRLTVLRSDDASNAAAAAVVAAFVAKAQKTPALVVVDAGGGAAADTDAAACLIAALASKDLAQVQVEGIRDDALLSHDELEACLPYGADGEVRRVNWAGFLEASKGLPLIPAKEAPLKLPPPVAKDQGLATDDQGLPADSKWWCDAVVANWLDLTQAPMSSAGGLALAARAGALATQSGRGGFGRGAGERGGAAEDADGRGQPAPAYLSPYLRWGVVSPRQAAASGVRRRDLLWRDFSRVCWRHFPALQEGTPVNADSADLWDYKTKAPFGECEAPHWDNDRVGKWTPELSGGAEGGARPGGASDAAETGASAAAASWSAGCTTSEAFEAWCVGRTGAPLVDAGMKQLWRCGWMPRRIRLLAASCLVEGLGVDWRHGRDWMAYTLIDHDHAINECMWQNAGLVGIDPFYRGLEWDVEPIEPPQSNKSKKRSKLTAPVEPSDFANSKAYVNRWLRDEDSPPYPPALHAALQRPRPAREGVAAAALGRRGLLGDAYRRAGQVAKRGIALRPGTAARVPLAAVAAEGTIEVGHLRFRVPPVLLETRWVSRLGHRRDRKAAGPPFV